MKDTTLTKTEAINAMHEGKKVQHRYFAKDEWITITSGGYLFEDGIVCPPHSFWQDRKSEDWQTGWSILQEKDTTLTELFDLMKAYEKRHNYAHVYIELSTKSRGVICVVETEESRNTNYEPFESLPDLIEKLKK